jgi:lipid-A-disaccharide synthase
MEGIGSVRLAAEGVRLLMDYGSISVVGITEVVRHLPSVFGALRLAVRRASRPDVGAILLVDFPDFNFRVGKAAHAKKVPVVYYIPPQLWAWRPERARDLARFTDGVVVPFPFEEPILKAKGVRAVFAGHPLLDELRPFLEAGPDPGRFAVPEGARLVGLLPGSRIGEIRAHLPAMASAARALARRFPDVHFAVPLASPRFRAEVEEILRGPGLPATVVENDRHLLYRGMTTAVAASGTATLELALLGVPCVIVYRTSPITYRIGKRLAAVTSIGLPNIVAGEPFLPELIQDECRPDRIEREISDLLSSEERRSGLAARCRKLRDLLQGPGPSGAVVDMLAEAAGDVWG